MRFFGCLAAIFALFAATAEGQEAARDFQLNQRGCLQFQFGIQVVLQLVENVLKQYVDRYNREDNMAVIANPVFRTQKFETKKAGPEVNVHFTDLQVEKMGPEFAEIQFITHIQQRNDLFVDADFQAKSSLTIKIEQLEENLGLTITPQHEIRSCDEEELQNHPQACSVVSDLTEDKLFAFSDQFFNQPSAARLLLGLRDFINRYSAEYATHAHFRFVSSALQILINCPSERIEVAESQPVESDEFELGLTDNIFDFFYPHELSFDSEELKEFVGGLKHSKWSQLLPVLSRLTDLDQGASIKTTRDQRKLNRFEGVVQKAGITILPNDNWDKLNIKKISQLHIRWNLFLEIKSSEGRIAVLPIEFQQNMMAGFRPGIRTISGQTFESSDEFLEPRVEVKPCVGSFKPSICKAEIQESVNSALANELRQAVKITFSDFLSDIKSAAKHNVWYVFKEIEPSYALMCAGLEMLQPEPSFRNEGIFLRAKFRHKPTFLPKKNWWRPLYYTIDRYCDNDNQELKRLHPNNLINEIGRETLEAQMANTSDYWFSDLGQEEWFLTRYYHHELKVISPVLHQMTSHFAYKDYCKDYFRNFDTFKCAMVLQMSKKMKEFDTIQGPKPTRTEMTDIHRMPFKRFSHHLLYLGLLLHLLGIRLNKKFVLFLALFMNIGMYLPYLFTSHTRQTRIGYDTPAYINQAGQFISGQTNYEKLSSVQGPCFYPAGHLWHYVPVYFMFLKTDLAEYYLLGIHFVLHSIIVALIVSLAYTYFKHAPSKAQFIFFCLISNEYVRFQNTLCFNDTLLSLYVVLCLSFVTWNRPLWAAFALTLALSIKAGGMLLVPSFLGWVQYQYGPWKLAAALALIVAFQYVIILPIIHPYWADLMGFKGEVTSLSKYLEVSKLLGGSSEYQHGATYLNTLYWKFLPESFYSTKAFVKLMQVCLLGVNIYYFFFRQSCLGQCLAQLVKVFNGKKWKSLRFSHEVRLKALEVILVAYFAGVNFVPGGHQQFLIWYQDFIPLLIQMTGIPALLSFNWYWDIYPIEVEQPSVHHCLSLALVAILLSGGSNTFSWIGAKADGLVAKVFPRKKLGKLKRD